MSAIEQTPNPKSPAQVSSALAAQCTTRDSSSPDGDIKDHQQPSTAQKAASERESPEAGKGSDEAGNRNKKKVLLIGMLNSTV